MTNTFKLTLMSGIAAAAVMSAGAANATNGMLPSCVGTVKCGMGGAGSAIAGAAVDAALNPALAANMGNEYQINLGWFWADVKGLSTFGAKTEESSGADNFPNGSLGVNYVIDDKMNFNLSIVPGGGGASDWPTSRTNAGVPTVGATNDQHVTYEMAYLQPSVGYKMSDTVSLGVGAILSRATMNTDSVTAGYAPGSWADKDETFYGVGFQVGTVIQTTDSSSFALNVRSPVWHKNTGVYDGNVFTDPIDTPMQVTAGLAVDMTPKTTLALDYKWVNWSGVSTIGNPTATGPVASRGFGWDDQNIIMLGLQHAVTDAATVRVGFSHANSPISSDVVLANFLFPAIVEDHFTAGGSYDLGNGMEIGVSGYWAPENELVDSNAAAAGGGSYLKHSQKGFQLSFSNAF